MPDNAPHNALRNAVNRAIAAGSPVIVEQPTPSAWLAAPDNAADKTIHLAISGNRLVSVLNALDAALFANGRYRFEGDSIVADAPWFAELRQTTESIRDELSRQRCAKEV